MKIPFEENKPYCLLTLTVLALFYGIYFSKILIQHRHGIKVGARFTGFYFGALILCI